jgi:hypothetical protein
VEYAAKFSSRYFWKSKKSFLFKFFTLFVQFLITTFVFILVFILALPNLRMGIGK